LAAILNRNEVDSMYTNKKILITGGTGTLGYHLTKRLLQYSPQVIRIFSRDEHKQYEMSQELQQHSTHMRYLIGDVRDQQRLLRAMEDIDYVFHLAAMKHVPFCEYNPFEAVQTNVIGTQNVIQAAIQAGVSKVLFTSSDKAISPTNTYGATKLMGERLISAAEYQKGPKSTTFSSVRFGNVMGSRGSVIPLFKKQILEQGYVTVTDPEMLRYMMTPSQAIELILKANEMARGGEIFVLKMPIVKIHDLAEAIICEYGHKLKRKSVEVKIVGLRQGEKREEEIMSSEEKFSCIEKEDMFIIPSIFSDKAAYIELGKSELHLNSMIINQETLRKWLLEENLL
jgi:FlaA1/EpsC-like NDP-sugar epimerase